MHAGEKPLNDTGLNHAVHLHVDLFTNYVQYYLICGWLNPRMWKHVPTG